MEKGWSRKELAEKVGVSVGAIGYYETGQRTPRIGVAKKLGDVLGFDHMEYCE